MTAGQAELDFFSLFLMATFLGTFSYSSHLSRFTAKHDLLISSISFSQFHGCIFSNFFSYFSEAEKSTFLWKKYKKAPRAFKSSRNTLFYPTAWPLQLTWVPYLHRRSLLCTPWKNLCGCVLSGERTSQS